MGWFYLRPLVLMLYSTYEENVWYQVRRNLIPICTSDIGSEVPEVSDKVVKEDGSFKPG